jgi:excinuclease ABC subunit C
VAVAFQFEHTLPFSPAEADQILRAIPAKPGVFALCGPRKEDAPYLTHTTDLRRRMRRLLDPPESQSKRLNLRDKVARIEYTLTGSKFESSLVLYDASAFHFGYAEARRRLKLHTPYFLRIATENEFPRVYATNRLSRRALAHLYGPFPSRAAAERYCDAVLDLFKLRRCHEDLEPYPEHPGCVYGEMKKCLEPCKQACTGEQYAAETSAVTRFFDTRGESMIIQIGLDREAAAANLEFERAAALHAEWHKVKAAAAFADWIVRPIPRLRAIIVQPAAHTADDIEEAALFLLEGGCLVGPRRLSTLGVRAVREQTTVGSSLFAQPLMLQAIPLDGDPANATPDSPEERATQAIASLESAVGNSSDLALLSDHLSLLRRWYYRPEKQRSGEIFIPNPEGQWPVRRILRGAARMAIGDPKPMAETQRDAAPDTPSDAAAAAAQNLAPQQLETRTIHEGRPDVERVVPVISRRRSRRSRTDQPADPPQPPGES